jgi:hypothetical protein
VRCAENSAPLLVISQGALNTIHENTTVSRRSSYPEQIAQAGWPFRGHGVVERPVEPPERWRRLLPFFP